MSSEMKGQAEAAFSKHIPSGYTVRKLEQDKGRTSNQVVFDWEVEYADGHQIQGTCYLSGENGYSVCMTAKFDEGSWSFPHNWHHGFLDQEESTSDS